jgi:FAD synthase
MIIFEREIKTGSGESAAVGFPTANLDQLENKLPIGVYVADVSIKGLVQTYKAMVIASSTDLRIHVYDYSGEDVTGQTMQVSILKQVRGPRPVKIMTGVRYEKTGRTKDRQRMVAYNNAAQTFLAQEDK